MTHDYKRHGTTTLFAALNVLQGTVIADCMPRHRNQKFLLFLRRLDREFICTSFPLARPGST
jgi:putative transposase